MKQDIRVGYLTTTGKMAVTVLEAAHAMTVNFGQEHGQDIPLLVEGDGRKFIPASWRAPAPGNLERDFLDHARLLGRVPRDDDIAIAGDILYRTVPTEYMWRVLLESRREDRPPQVEMTLTPGCERPWAPSDPAYVYFRWDRQADASAFADRMVRKFGATGLVRRHPGETATALRPDLLRTDDFVHTATMAESAVKTLVHNAMTALPRGAIETWLEMRRPSAADGDARAACAEFAERTGDLVGAIAHLDPRNCDTETGKWVVRAKRTLDFLAERFACEPELRPGNRTEFEPDPAHTGSTP